MQFVFAGLLTHLKKASQILLQFTSFLVLGIAVVIVYALPWFLRLCAILLWLFAGYIGLTQLDTLYSPYSSSPIPIFALQFALILLLVAMPMAGMLRKPGYIWGGMAAGGTLIGLIFWKLVPWLLAHWQHAALFFRVLPSMLSITLLTTATLRMKQLTSKGGDARP